MKNQSILLFGSSGKLGSQVASELQNHFDLKKYSRGDVPCDSDWLIDCMPAPELLNYNFKNLKSKIILCSTGWNLEELKQFPKERTYLLPNLSTILQLAVVFLSKLPKSQSVHIEEFHRVGKKDPISGTALWISRALEKKGHNVCLPKPIRYDDLKGTHIIKLNFGNQILTLRHDVLDRSAFASGALYWLQNPEIQSFYKLENFL